MARRSQTTGKGRQKSSTRPGKRNKPSGTAPNKKKATNHRGSKQAAAPAKPAKVAKTTLSTEELEYFRELLLAKRKQLVSDVAGLKDQVFSKSRSEAAGDLSSMPIHMADIGTDNYEQEFALDLLENENDLLGEIDQALERIANGTYGVCLATGKSISKTRLKFKPWAKYSVAYARRQEKNNSSHQGGESRK